MATERPGNPPRRPGNGVTAALCGAFRHPGFLACIILLASLTVAFEVLAIWKHVIFRKEALELRTPFERLNHEKLAPYGVGHINALEANMVNRLGTDQYLSWQILDPYPPGSPEGTPRDLAQLTEREKAGWPRQINLFLTYYTGQPDQVPHVPEVCYAGGGHERTGKDSLRLTVPGLGDDQQIPVWVLEFVRQGMHGTSRRIVMYTFHANGKFRADRRDVQVALANPTTRYAYFSKLELSMDVGPGYATRDEAIEAGSRFLEKVVPVLLEDHWPDWEAANREGGPTPDPDLGAADRPGDD